MLTIVSGNLGAGKTLLLVILGFHAKKRVISNYNLEFKHEVFSLYKFANSEYDNATILIDEAYSILESRDSMSSKNKALSYILFQSRKKTIDMFLTVQLNSTLDLRYRNLADNYIYAWGIIHSKGQFYFKYTLYNRNHKPITKYLPLDFTKKYMDLYDTNEVIKPQKQDELVEEFKTPKEQLETVESLANKIKEDYKDRKITKGMIKLWLFKNKQPKRMLDFIYETIKMEREEDE